MTKPTLVVLAAGMGSRYGGLKQLDGLGPSGETIMDYSVYDAKRAGFGKVVFIIRHSFEEDFRKIVLPKYQGIIDVEVVFQEMDKLPEGFSVPEGREKPWGTNHATMMAKEVVNEPFAVINADDFYGRDSFEVLAKKLSSLSGSKGKYCMVGYRVGNTLSESGSVARGVCQVNDQRMLTGVVERTAIERNAEGKIAFTDENGLVQTLEEDTPVSMNMWGFTPDYFEYSDRNFVDFLRGVEGNLKAEFFIPLVVNQLIESGEATCEVLDTTARWFGVTYAADRPDVVAKINALVAEGQYPSRLF